MFKKKDPDNKMVVKVTIRHFKMHLIAAGIVLALLLLGAASPLPPAWAASARGYAEFRGHYLYGTEGKSYQFMQLIRPEFMVDLSDRVVLAATLEAGLSQGRNVQQEFEQVLYRSPLGPILDGADCQWPRHSNSLLGVSSAQDYLRVERLFLDFYLAQGDLRVGRQAINWGSALLVNPTDPFPEVLLLEPWRARRGVNAIRATLRMWQDHQLQAVLGLDDSLTKVRAAGRATFRLESADISLVGAYREETGDGIAGFDLRGNLEVGYWLEGAVALRSEPYGELAVGIDYSFPVLDNLVIAGQYYHNGRSASQDANATTANMASATAGAVVLPICQVPCADGQPGAMFDLHGSGGTKGQPDPFAPIFKGRHYGMLSASLNVSPEISLSALWIQNIEDGSALAVPTVTLLPNGWLEVAAAVQLPFSLWGNGGELNPRADDLIVHLPVADDQTIPIDMGGLVPSATFILWSRAAF